MSEIADLAEAVKDALNDAVASSGLSQAFTAKRTYIPAFDLKDLGDLSVRVVPKAYTRTRSGREGTDRETSIDIGIAQRVTTACLPETEGGNVELDPFISLVEEIAELFDNGGDVNTDAEWIRTEVPDPIYDVAKLKDERTALSVVRVVFIIH